MRRATSEGCGFGKGLSAKRANEEKFPLFGKKRKGISKVQKTGEGENGNCPEGCGR